MFQVNGVVENSYNKQKTSRAGKNFTINYIEVDGVTISTGFKQEHTNGEMVNIAVEKKYNEWQKVDGRTGDGLPPIGTAPAPVVKGNFGSGGKSPSRTFPVDPHDGQMSIIRQNSMNRAVEIMAQWNDMGLLKDDMTETEYLQKLIEVALNVTDFNSGQDIMKLQAAQAANKAINGE